MASDTLAELRAASRFTESHEWSANGRTFFLGISETALSLYEPDSTAVHFDLDGRWTRAVLPAGRFLRALDGNVLARVSRLAQARSTHDLGHDHRLSPTERAGVHEKIWALVEAAAGPAALAPALAYTPAQLEAEATRFLEAYRPVGILPPDRYRSLIIQATEGCVWNGCVFCSLYLRQAARTRALPELREHVMRVKALVGRGLAERRGVFLGEANALATPQATLLDILDVVREALPDQVNSAGPGGGVASFIDAFTESEKGPREYDALRERGLRRVFVGVESGSEPVLGFLRKPATRAGIISTVSALKAGGLSAGVILLVGGGGARWSAEHVAESASLVESLPLDARDVIYLSPLVHEPQGRFARAAEREQLALLSEAELGAEEASLRVALAGSPAQLARYDVRRFVYS